MMACLWGNLDLACGGLCYANPPYGFESISADHDPLTLLVFVEAEFIKQ